MKHHPCPLIKIPVSTHARQGPRGCGADGAGIIGRRIERLHLVTAILLLIDAMLVRADEDYDRRSDQTVFTQLLGRAGRVRSDGFGQLMRVGDGPSEGTGDQHALPRTGVLDDIMAGDAA